jgi:D-methionine transport system substrate-binding protein
MRLRDLMELCALLVCTSGVWACKPVDKTLKVGVVGRDEEAIAQVAAEVAKQRHGIDVRLVTFSDYVNPNAAVADGSLDANAFQHRPFLERQIQDRGYKLVVVANTFVYPMAAYSLRLERLVDLPDGATIAVPSDPSNMGRALALLDEQGLFELKPGVGTHATTHDIAANPRKLHVLEIEAALLPRYLGEVELAVMDHNFAARKAMRATENGLFHEDDASPYVNVIVSREDNRNKPELRAFVEAYQSDEVYAKARSLFGDGVTKGW